MNVALFYQTINGNYEEALSRLMNDVLIEKFLTKFKNNQKLDELENAINDHDLEKAFMEVHTLKGVALNLSLTPLAEACSKLTEMLRGDNKYSANEKEYTEAFLDIKIQYKLIIDNIN